MSVSQDLCAQVVFGETGILRAPGGDEDQLAAARRFIAGVIYARYEGHESRFAPPQKPTEDELGDQTIKKHWGLCQQAASAAASDNVGTCRHFVVSWLNDAGDGPSPDDPDIKDTWPITEKAKITKQFGPFTRLARQDIYILKYCGVALFGVEISSISSETRKLSPSAKRNYKSSHSVNRNYNTKLPPSVRSNDNSLPYVAAIVEDGEFLILHPEGAPSQLSYRMHRDDVTLISASHAYRDGRTSRLYLNLRIQPDAQCMLSRIGTVRELLQQFTPTAETLLLSTTLQVSVEFKGNGEGVLRYGDLSVPCLGKPGQSYPRDQTIENIEGIQDVGDYGSAYKFKRWVSSQFVDSQGNPAVMLWSVKIDGARGVFIHEDPDSLAENGGPSQGCIHLSTANAQPFYNWITARTRLQISYPW